MVYLRGRDLFLGRVFSAVRFAAFRIHTVLHLLLFIYGCDHASWN